MASKYSSTDSGNDNEFSAHELFYWHMISYRSFSTSYILAFSEFIFYLSLFHFFAYFHVIIFIKTFIKEMYFWFLKLFLIKFIFIWNPFNLILHVFLSIWFFMFSFFRCFTKTGSHLTNRNHRLRSGSITPIYYVDLDRRVREWPSTTIRNYCRWHYRRAPVALRCW